MNLQTLRAQQIPLWLWALMLLAVLLRFMFLDSNSFWFDESFSAHEAAKPISVILAGTDSRHPPLYYATLHFWRQIFGPSEWSLRLPSALASLLNLGLVYWLGKHLFEKGVALTAVLLLAFSPLDIWYAQEARMYMLVATVGLCYALALLWPSRWRVLSLTVLLTVGSYLDYSAIPLLFGITAVWLVYWWRTGRQGHLLASAGTALVLAAVLYIPWWPKFEALLNSLSNVHIFANFRAVFNLPLFSSEQVLLALALFTLGFTLAGHALANLLQKTNVRQVITWAALFAFLIFLPIAVMPRLYTVKRVMITGWPFAILLAAWLFNQWKNTRKVSRWGLTALSLAASMFMLLTVAKDDWRSVAAHLEQSGQTSRVIWVDPAWNEIALRYYAAEADVHRGNLEELASFTSKELWLVAERLPSQTPPSSASEAWLDDHMELIGSETFTRLELRRYQPLQVDNSS